MRRRMTAWLLTALAAYGLLVGLLYLFQRSMMYLPDTNAPRLAIAGLPGMQEVWLDTQDGLRLLSWYRPPAPDQPLIAYFHGNGGNIHYRANRVREAFDPRWGILLLGYRGYGGNPGRPTEAGLVTDANAALEFLRAQSIPPDRIVLYGESLGSGVAVSIASQHRVAAVILEAPFTSASDVAQHHYFYVPARLLLKDKFDSLSRIGEVRAPVLVLHGALDSVVPMPFGQTLLAAAREPKEGKFYPEAGHHNLYTFGAAEAVRDFLGRHLRSPAS